jgi:hypothetical protein
MRTWRRSRNFRDRSTLAGVALVVILGCAFVIVGLTYYGVGAWLRDRELRRRSDPGAGEH